LTALSAEFDGMLSRLEEAFQRLTVFASDLAHELRTPLNNLMGEAEVAVSRDRDAAAYRTALESCLEEGRRMTQIVESLLFIARADNPAMSIEISTLHARAVAEAVVDYLAPWAEEYGVALSCSGQAVFRGNEALVRRALNNVIENAVQHTPRGGRVAVDLAAATERPGAVITVRDSGHGIPREHLERLFDRHYRVPRRDCDAHPGGLGLGLAIVQSIMRLHGGDVRITSAPEEGVTVRLFFPASGPEAGRPS
jgi:two-component system heavy metal sensor histidine kinase CusS